MEDVTFRVNLTLVVCIKSSAGAAAMLHAALEAIEPQHYGIYDMYVESIDGKDIRDRTTRRHHSREENRRGD